MRLGHEEGAKIMNDGLRRRLREEDLAFFGRIGADVSHDMRNVLSVIGEYAGLLDDLLARTKSAKKLDLEKVKNLAAKVTRQVNKGTDVMQRFSSFAHATDEQTTSFDLTALTANIAALAQRRVKMGGCRLEAELPDDAIPVRTSAFSAQYAVFSAIELILERVEKGELIKLNLIAEGPTAVISISGSASASAGDQLSGETSQLSAVMEELNGTIEASCVDGIVSVALAIPCR